MEFDSNSCDPVFPFTTAINGTNFEIYYTRGIAAISGGVTFAVEWTDNLSFGIWSSAGLSEFILNNNGITQNVKITTSISPNQARFYRLKTSQ
jgi:hypothetical protein